MGTGSLISGYMNENLGGTFIGGYVGGQVSGLFAYIPFIGGAIGGFAASFVTSAIDGKDIELTNALFSGLVGFAFSLIPSSVYVNSISKVSQSNISYPVLLDYAMYGYSVVSSMISALLEYLFGDE